MKTIKGIGLAVAFFAAILAITFALNAIGLANFKFWGVLYEDARRENFEETKSYRQGSIQRLGTLCTQVAAAEDKALLNGVIAHEFSEWELTDVPSHLRPCLADARK